MQDRATMERRIRELEAQVAMLKGGVRRIRMRTDAEFGGLPLFALAAGPDPEKGERCGHARGIVALGDIATGVIALGGIARGVLAIGGVAIGAVSIGGVSVGAIAAVGGLAIGGLAVGGGAAGYGAIGGAAVGEYACGGAAFGEHVSAPYRQDPEAIEHFARYGLEGLCMPRRPRRY